MGIPKTGAFGLYDLIGLDLMGDVVRSLNTILDQGDPFMEVGGENKVVNDHVARGHRGDKSGMKCAKHGICNLKVSVRVYESCQTLPSVARRAASMF